MLSRLHDKARRYRKTQVPTRTFEDASESDGLNNEKTQSESTHVKMTYMIDAGIL